MKFLLFELPSSIATNASVNLMMGPILAAFAAFQQPLLRDWEQKSGILVRHKT
jgi:hypothetical protein